MHQTSLTKLTERFIKGFTVIQHKQQIQLGWQILVVIEIDRHLILSLIIIQIDANYPSSMSVKSKQILFHSSIGHTIIANYQTSYNFKQK